MAREVPVPKFIPDDDVFENTPGARCQNTHRASFSFRTVWCVDSGSSICRSTSGSDLSVFCPSVGSVIDFFF